MLTTPVPSKTCFLFWARIKVRSSCLQQEPTMIGIQTYKVCTVASTAFYLWAILPSYGALPLRYLAISWCSTSELSRHLMVLYLWAISPSHGAQPLSYLAISWCSTSELFRHLMVLHLWVISPSHGAQPMSYSAILWCSTYELFSNLMVLNLSTIPPSPPAHRGFKRNLCLWIINDFTTVL